MTLLCLSGMPPDASAVFHQSVVSLQDYDRQLQRALNYEDFDMATELRQRREQLTEAVTDFQVGWSV